MQVHTKYHEKNVTRIKSHVYQEESKLAKNIRTHYTITAQLM